MAVVAWLRLDGNTRGTLWAEDGYEFITDALHGASVFTPYDGYLHVVPRMIADLVVLCVPVPQYAVAMTAASMLVAAAIGLLVFGVTAHLGLSRWARAGLALLAVLAPALITEVSGNAANLHWLFLWLSPWLFLARPATRSRAVMLGLVALLATTTEIQTVLFLPLLLVGARDRLRWPLAVGALTGATAQLTVLLLTGREGTPGHPGLESTVNGYPLQVAGGAWTTPVTSVIRGTAEHGWFVAYGLLVPFVLAAGVIVLRAPHLRTLVGALLGGSFVVWAAGFQLNYPADADVLALIGSLRHAVVPSMFLLALAVIAADQLVASAGPRAWAPRAVGGLLAACVAAACVLSADGRGDSLRSNGPGWAPAVAEARSVCLAEGATSVDITIAPGGDRWTFAFSCRRLTDDR
jgi:hypothetical protein